MRLSHQLNLQQSQEQKLVMTPKLQQAIELLQFSTLELKEYIEDEMMDNPLLKLEDNYRHTKSGSYSNYDQEEVNYENFIAKELTLEEHLIQQLNLVTTDVNKQKIGEYIIGSLNDLGFFPEEDVNNVADSLQVDKSQVKEVLNKIKEFDPLGIATSGVKESLLIQLEDLKSCKDIKKINLTQKIVNNYLEEVSKNQIRKISKNLSIDLITAQGLVDLIKSLDPIPTNKFKRVAANSYLEPDVIVRKIKDRYVIIMSESSFPTLQISNYYKKLLQKNKGKDGFRDYIKEKLDSALWLVKSIEQRRRTIYNIVQEITNLQEGFLEQGLKKLKPMTMKEIADRIDMHESTVSRATNGKYLQTPQGLFPMKFFFSKSIKSQNGMISAVSVKKELKDIIAQEDSTNPLSDQKICDQLQKKGIDISRRTVAKYRKELRIPTSRMRKRYD